MNIWICRDLSRPFLSNWLSPDKEDLYMKGVEREINTQIRELKKEIFMRERQIKKFNQIRDQMKEKRIFYRIEYKFDNFMKKLMKLCEVIPKDEEVNNYPLVGIVVDKNLDLGYQMMIKKYIQDQFGSEVHQNNEMFQTMKKTPQYTKYGLANARNNNYFICREDLLVILRAKKEYSSGNFQKRIRMLNGKSYGLYLRYNIPRN